MKRKYKKERSKEMKKGILFLVFCFLLVFPALSLAATGWYGSVNAGVAFVPDSDVDFTFSDMGSGTGELSYDTGYTVGGALGYMMDQFRVEGEVSYQSSGIDTFSAYGESESVSGDITALTFLVNGYFDFATGGPWTPYITAGLGYSNVEVDSDDDNLFTYQLGVGIGYAMNEKVTWDLRYRYLGFEDYEYSDWSDSVSVEASSHNITLGLRFAF